MENIQSYIGALRARGINVIEYSPNVNQNAPFDGYLRIVIELSDIQMEIVRANLRFTAIEKHLESACMIAKANKSVETWVDAGTIVMNSNIIEIRSLTGIIDIFLGRILKQ